MKKTIAWLNIVAVVVAIILLAAVFVQNYKSVIRPVKNNEPISKQSEIISAVFNCRDNKSIQVKFYPKADEFVDLVLSDGRTWRLPRAISASGARYASEDESLIFWNKGDTAFIEESGKMTFADCAVSSQINDSNAAPAGLANPASVNCQTQGGRLVMANRPNGGEYGLCYFDDNRACEEWAMFRGECPVGGVKTTGYDTQAQRFCAWSGGRTLAVANAVCVFANGSSCLADDFYAGSCQKAESVSEAIKELFKRKYPKYAATLAVTAEKEALSHVRGSVSFAPGAPGGIFLAAKVDGAWQIVHDGNGEIPCSLAKYGFPSEMLSGCAKF